MTVHEIRGLATRCEDSNLDFKQEMYDWDNDGNYELAKDLMAMANKLGPTAAPAHILVGVDKNGSINGIDPGKHLDDASMQQKVRSLLNRQPNFSYMVVDVGGRSIGVFQVRPESRPFRSVKDVGKRHKLIRHLALQRVGSSTESASPDQVIEWAREDDPTSAKLRALELEEKESKLAICARIGAPGSANSGDNRTYRFEVYNDGIAPFRVVAARMRWRVDEVKLRGWLAGNAGRLVVLPSEVLDDGVTVPQDTAYAEHGSEVTLFAQFG